VKSIITLILANAVLVLLAVISPGALNSKVVAQENQSQSNNEQQATQNQSYNYVAQSGDSYTLMARKAVQTYGLENNVNLSEAQIIFAETNITRDAESPELNVGQKVEISSEKVKNWVDKAKELTEKQQAVWDQYTSGVNFNTNNVGQAS
jgi:hypothetical protein